LLLTPGLEGRFLVLYKGAGFQSTRFHSEPQNGGYVHCFQEWGRYSLTEIMYSRSEGQFAGFYNDLMQWEYAPRVGFNDRFLGAVPINVAPAGGKIAIIGAGGGRQVKWALQPRFSFQKILAIELEPVVIEAVRGPLRDAFDSVYERPPVEPIVSEARSYMEKSEETFDLIFLPSVGGYPQMMLEPGNMIRTIDAYRTLRNRLTDRGILAIWYPCGLDPQSILTNQYVRTLGAPGLGMKTQAYANRMEYLIFAAKDPKTPLPTLEEINGFFTSPVDSSGLPPDNSLDVQAHYFYVADDPRFKPITDDQPFLAGNVSHIFSLGQVYVLFANVVSLLTAACILILILLRKTGDPRIPGRPYWQVAGLALLIGANFILVEHYVVLLLFKKLYVFQDALTIGAISFLVLTGLGSILIGRRTRGFFQALAMLLVLPIVFFQETLSPPVAVALLAPLAFATGSFFPGLFEMAFRNPLSVFAMDAIGAAVGSCVSFFIPIAFGFSAFFVVGVLVFLLTSFFTWRFCRTPRVVESL